MITPNTISIYRTVLLRALFVLTLIITSCSAVSGDDEEVTRLPQSAVSNSSELESAAGSAKITYTGKVGMAWTAEITAGNDFLSFSKSSDIDSKSGKVISAANNTLFFYFTSNGGSSDRKGTITFTFSNSESFKISFVQYTSTSECSPYNSETDKPRWVEIPAKVNSDDYMYVSHFTSLNGGDVRNFSFCLDKDNYAAAWVAYPYHKVYDEGNGYRTDKWQFDPVVPRSYQPNLDKSYKSFGGKNYDRGHQMPSADRLATVEMNRQTFYYTNMTPQLSTLNQQKWGAVEGKVRDQVCSDTLYVVTGADFTTTIGAANDTDGKPCPIPGAYFKVMLRTRAGNSGKAISQCSASELKAIGYWFEHEHYVSIPAPMSVKEIEERTGFTFFPSVPAEVKAECKASDWVGLQ